MPRQIEPYESKETLQHCRRPTAPGSGDAPCDLFRSRLVDGAVDEAESKQSSRRASHLSVRLHALIPSPSGGTKTIPQEARSSGEMLSGKNS
jgi:hypothetical protein